MVNSTSYFVSVQRGLLCLGSVDGFYGSYHGGRRDTIGGFSAESRKRLLGHLRNSVADYTQFVTLTYPPTHGSQGRQCKRDLRNFMERLKRIQTQHFSPDCGFDGRKWSVVWFLEWQKNGRAHFHLCCSHFLAKDWLSRVWYEVVGSGNKDHLAAGTNVRPVCNGRGGLGAYAAKYCAKSEQKDVPVNWGWVGRFWGIWGCRDTVSAATVWTSPMCWNRRVDDARKALIERVNAACHSKDLTLIDESSSHRPFVMYKMPDDGLRRELCALVCILESYMTLDEPDVWNDQDRRERKFLRELTVSECST